MAALSAIIGLAGAAVSAAGTIAAGKAQKDAKEFEAKQLEIQGQEERAAAQREVESKQKERDLILSRQQAVSAASGLGALDPTVQDLAGDVVQESSFQTGMMTYGAEERARGRRAQAAAARYEGDAALKGAKFAAAGTLIGGIGSFAKQFAQSAQAASGGGNYRYG